MRCHDGVIDEHHVGVIDAHLVFGITGHVHYERGQGLLDEDVVQVPP